GLVPDAGEALRRRAVAGQLVDAAQQYWDVFELRPGPLLDFRDQQMRQIGVGAAEIEMKLDLGHGVTTSRRRAGSRARTTRRRAVPDRSANRLRRPIPAASASTDRGWRGPPRPRAPGSARAP